MAPYLNKLTRHCYALTANNYITSSDASLNAIRRQTPDIFISN